jgi:hypothetical protein
MEKLNTKFPIKKINLKHEFPLPREITLSKSFPFSKRLRAVNSGYLNKDSISINSPTYTPPKPIFVVRYGVVDYPSDDTYSFSGYKQLTFTNNTEDSSYTSLQWTILHVETNTTLPAGINQTYVLTPIANDTIQTFVISLKAFLANVQGETSMTIILNPASINSTTIDHNTASTITANDVITRIFSNTSEGIFDNYQWEAIGYIIQESGNTASISFIANDNQPPLEIKLSLISGGNVVETITQRETFTVLPAATASMNNESANYVTSITVVEGDVVPFIYNNTSTGTYDLFQWSSTGIIVPSTGSPINVSLVAFRNVFDRYLMFTSVTLTLYKQGLVVGTVTNNVTLAVLPKATAAINGQISDFVSPVTFDEDAGIALNFANTSTGTYDTLLWSATGGTLSSTTGNAVSIIKVATVAMPPIVVTLSLSRAGTVVDTRTYTVSVTVLPKARVSFDGNTTDFATTSTSDYGIAINFSLTNTSTGTYNTFRWRSTSGLNVQKNLVNNMTVSPLSFSIVPSSNNPIFNMILEILKNGVVVGSVTRTHTFVITGSSKIMTNAIAMCDFDPVPQALATTYQSLNVQWIPGVPAIESALYQFVTTTSNTVQAKYFNYQGTNKIAALLKMSADTSKINAGGTYYVRGAVANFAVADFMEINSNIVGGIYAGQRSGSFPFGIELGQPLNSINYFDQFQIDVPLSATKTYLTAYETYLSNNLGMTDSVIKNDRNYFQSDTGRFQLNIQNSAKVTFTLPTGNRYCALITGALLVNNETSPIWGIKGERATSIRTMDSNWISTDDYLPNTNNANGNYGSYLTSATSHTNLILFRNASDTWCTCTTYIYKTTTATNNDFIINFTTAPTYSFDIKYTINGISQTSTVASGSTNTSMSYTFNSGVLLGRNEMQIQFKIPVGSQLQISSITTNLPAEYAVTSARMYTASTVLYPFQGSASTNTIPPLTPESVYFTTDGVYKGQTNNVNKVGFSIPITKSNFGDVRIVGAGFYGIQKDIFTTPNTEYLGSIGTQRIGMKKIRQFCTITPTSWDFILSKGTGGQTLVNNYVQYIDTGVEPGYASLFNITSRVTNNQITFGKASGNQEGSVIGFYIFANAVTS